MPINPADVLAYLGVAYYLTPIIIFLVVFARVTDA